MATKARSDMITLIRVNDGAKGNPGTSVTSTIDEWYLSTSSTGLSGGSWSSTRQTWSSGKYYWRRVKTTYSNGSTGYTPSANGYFDPAMTSAVSDAENAYKIAENTNAYFFVDNNGAHVATVGNKPDEGSNVLIDPSSVKFRNGNTVVSEFGQSGANIGKTDSMHINITSDSIRFLNNTNQGAYMSNSRFYATAGTFNESLHVGNYVFRIDNNENLVIGGRK